MRVEFTNDFTKCIYTKETCLHIKRRAEIGDDADRDENIYYAIWGDDVPSDIEFAGSNNVRCNECTAYTFYKHDNGKYVPVRATYSAKTLANFARAERKFGHLDPDCDI